jgi:hypothetical protein
MQRLIRLLTFLVITPVYTYGAASNGSPSSSSPIMSRLGGLVASGYNWACKTVDPYYPMVSEEYITGPGTVADLRAKEVAMELDFATTAPQTYRKYPNDYDIMTRFADRAGPTNRRLVDWLTSGNSEQLKACYDCVYNLSPLFRLLLELYWSEHATYRPATIEQQDFGVFESVNPFLSEPEQPPIELEKTIEASRKILAAKSGEGTISAAERKNYRRLYPEDFLINPREKAKHEAIYGLLEASANLARINKQPPVGVLMKLLAPVINQIATREYYIRQVAQKLLQEGAFDRMKEFYQIHRKNIPPVMAVIICDMLRTSCIDASAYLPPAYLDYYNTQHIISTHPVDVDPMLFKAANKFIFLLCNDLTTEERRKLYSASTEVLAARNKPATIWTHIKYTETRRSLLTRIDETKNVSQLFARLAKFMGIPTSTTNASPIPIAHPTSSPIPLSTSTQWDLDSHHPNIYSTSPMPLMPPSPDSQYEMHDGLWYHQLHGSPSSSLPPVLELPPEFRPDTTHEQERPR